MYYAKKEISHCRYCVWCHDLCGVGVGFRIEEETGGVDVDAGEFAAANGFTAGYFGNRGWE